jgi:hypothetical protein
MSGWMCSMIRLYVQASSGTDRSMWKIHFKYNTLLIDRLKYQPQKYTKCCTVQYSTVLYCTVTKWYIKISFLVTMSVATRPRAHARTHTHTPHTHPTHTHHTHTHHTHTTHTHHTHTTHHTPPTHTTHTHHTHTTHTHHAHTHTPRTHTHTPRTHTTHVPRSILKTCLSLVMFTTSCYPRLSSIYCINI